MNLTKLTLTNTMMIGVIMTVCSNNWMSMWMGLEMSLLSFIPFIHNKNLYSSESMMKYFITQCVASSIFLFSVIYMLIGVNMLNEMMMTTAMLIKLGSAPFHNWILMIVESMEFLPLLMFLTVLKLPPIMILYNMNTKMLSLPIALSLIMSTLSCVNQSSIRKTLGLSSIYNISLMLCSISKFNVIMTFITIYSLITMMIVLTFKIMKINFISQIMFNEFNFWMKINMWINVLSLGGFPPLMGFLIKILIIQSLAQENQMIMMTLVMISSILMMMFYLRLTFTSMLSLNLFKKWTLNKTKTLMYFIMPLNIMLTPMTMSLVSSL